MASIVSSHAARNRSRLEGRTVVIFGGTSGIGLAAAVQAKAAGAKVIVVGFDREGRSARRPRMGSTARASRT